MALCMEAFTDTLPIVCNGFMYGSIYRRSTNSVSWLYVWKHLQTLNQYLVCHGFNGLLNRQSYPQIYYKGDGLTLWYNPVISPWMVIKKISWVMDYCTFLSFLYNMYILVYWMECVWLHDGILINEALFKILESFLQYILKICGIKNPNKSNIIV